MKKEFADLSPMTMADLLERIESVFDCREGHYGPFARPSPERLGMRMTPAQRQAWEELHEPYRYITLMWRAKLDGKQDTPGLLRTALWGSFYTIWCQFPDREHIEKCGGVLERAKPVLYWRFAPGSRISEERVKNGRWVFCDIRTRVAVPDCDWSRVPHKTECAPVPRID